jgi:histidine triad (HIT) family protein
MSAANCIFCKIASGAIPSSKILEEDDCLAFLDVGPLAPGHALLIPRQHFTDLTDLDPALLARISNHFPRIASAVLKATGASGLNLLQNSGASSGQAVFHVHFHFIPRREGDGLGYRWNAGKYQAGEAKSMQSAIVSQLC